MVNQTLFSARALRTEGLTGQLMVFADDHIECIQSGARAENFPLGRLAVELQPQVLACEFYFGFADQCVECDDTNDSLRRRVGFTVGDAMASGVDFP